MDYDKYRMSKTEVIKYTLIYAGAAALISYTFYDSLYVIAAFIPAMIFYFKQVKAELKKARRERLTRQFTDMIDGVSTAMQAGYSAENAFHESYMDMLKLYGKESLIVSELESIFSKLDTGMALELILKDFAQRADTEDITDFEEIFMIAKLNGGNMSDIIKNTVRIMKDKEDTEKEIRVILSGRRYEQRIMCIIPFAIILYLKVSGVSYISILYHNPTGAAVMTVCLIIMAGAYYLSRKFIDIKV
ncbi:MAG: hypothetical protein K6E63_12605 [Lachnospiraceae bacterium]|nr:hypothetical protein [Lachnospiraceae bacterium]